ncbi:M20/M25/M40 family metallo-hydrolase [Bradyrhizobium sp. RDT10]
MSNAKIQSVLDHIDADFDNSLERLFALLRIKSISADPAFADDCKAAADHLAKDIATLGFKAEVRPTAGHPAIVAKNNDKANGSADGRPHVLFYGHYDVQPVDPLNLWHRPPFEPVVTDHADGRKIIVARGAEDDKGQLMTFVEACRAWKKVTGSLPVDITIVIEGEEEIGSKNFVPFLEANKGDLKADFALVCDTGMWDQNTPAITTSLRGLVYDEVKIKAANRDLHSGIFGGGARNPIRVLTNILGGLHDDNGHITIPGFYDGVKDLPPDILAQWKNLNLTPESFLKPIGLSIPAGEKDRLLIEQVSSRPTCDINGIIGGYTGEGSKTVIPAEASAKVSFRLVEGQNPEQISQRLPRLRPGTCAGRLQGRVHRPLQRAGDRARLEHEAAGGCQARADGRVGQGSAFDRLGRLDPDRGGFQRTLGLDTVLVGFGLDDDNIHSPNEKYDLKSYHKGIRSWARILEAFAEAK